MTDSGLNPVQVTILERFLRAGFRFLTLERYARYLAVEKNGFVALLDSSGGKLTLFSQVGYLMGDGIGMLVESPEGKAFVHHQQSVPATAELIAVYEQFKNELRELLDPMRRQV
jgi:hypothetical protein